MLPDKRGEWAYRKWQDVFARRRFAPDAEPGHLAWRTVVLHRRRTPGGGSLLDAGFGGGEDLVHCAEKGYSVTGLEFRENAVERTRELLAARGQAAELHLLDLRALDSPQDPTAGQEYDVVLFSNVSQGSGGSGPALP
jgi:2-polyprenyl-3-methyl-5-hydroxy-6-metoxy-1,4-benzoquinol methylase